MKVKIQAGAELDLLSPKEFNDGLTAAMKSWQGELARGGVFRDIQLSGIVNAAGAVEIGGPSVAQGIGPDPGFMWSIRRLYVQGLADGDAVTVYRNNTQPRDAVRPIPFAAPYAGFHPNEFVLKAGDKLVIAGVSLTVAAEIIVTGAAKEVPEFMSWAM
jgi:hypothetical protein